MLTVTTENKHTTSIPQGQLIFSHYPAYARFIRENHIVDYIKENLRLSHELDLPILRHLTHLSDGELIEMGLPKHIEFFENVEQNTLAALLKESLKRWENDELEIVGKDDLAADDIALVSFVRKQSLLKFLHLYTNDIDKTLHIIREIDTYEMEACKAATETYINLLHQRIYQHARFIESITNTTPSIIYVYDCIARKEVYTNRKMTEFLGYTHEDLQAMGDAVIAGLVHPADLEKILQYEKDFANIKDDEVRHIEYRMKTKNGNYLWLRTNEAVFSRSADGAIHEKIGIAVDIDSQKQAEELLHHRENQLLEAQELVNIGSYVWHISTDKVDVTPQYLKIFEVEGEPNRGEILKGVHPGDAERISAIRQKAVDECTVFEYEYRHYVNGKEKILWSRGTVTETEAGKVAKGTVMDVTDRHYMLQRLQRSELLFKQAQTMTHIGNWVWDLVRNKLEWSEELCRIYGIEPGTEIDLDTISRMNHPDDVQMVKSIINDSLQSHTPYDFHYRIVRNGSIVILHAKGEVITDINAQPVKMIGTCQDVTIQKTTEKQLKQHTDFIKKVTDVTPSVITTYNIHTGQYTFINKGMENLLGYTTDEILEKGIPFIMSLVHPDDLATVKEKNYAAIQAANNIDNREKEMISEFRYRVKNKAGEYRWLHTYGTVFARDEHGEVEQVLNVSVDITEQEEAEQVLNQKNIQLQQSNTSLEEYAHIASHDLKEPLRKISTFGDRLLATQAERLDDTGKLYLDKIVNASARMQTMIHDLLTISMIYGNREFETHSLQAVLEEVKQTLEYKIEECGAQINTLTLPEVKCVPSQMRQLFQNLISNSLKFICEGVHPEITISYKYLSPREIADRDVAPAEKYLQIMFADNGIGFDSNYASKIFTIFQRLHGRHEYEGNGIGLAICRKVAENHGGTIYAESTPGKGTKFFIIIPASI